MLNIASVLMRLTHHVLSVPSTCGPAYVKIQSKHSSFLSLRFGTVLTRGLYIDLCDLFCYFQKLILCYTIVKQAFLAVSLEAALVAG